MTKQLLFVSGILLFLTLTACSPQKQNIASIDYNFTLFDQKIIDHVEIDYAANCRIRLRTRSQNYAGVCQIILTRNNQFRLNLYYPTGGVITMLYMDDEQIELLDREQKKLLRLKNNPENRNNILPLADLEVSDLREVLWGRQFASQNTTAKYYFKDSLLQKIEKKIKGNYVLITIKKWLLYKNVSFPKVIRIIEKERGIDLKLVISEFTPGLFQGNIKIPLPPDYSVQNDI